MPPPHVQTNPQEDLSVVMGRFHAWDAKQNVLPPIATQNGLREVSYEEALAANSSRRAGHQPMALPQQLRSASRPVSASAIQPADLTSATKRIEESPADVLVTLGGKLTARASSFKPAVSRKPVKHIERSAMQASAKATRALTEKMKTSPGMPAVSSAIAAAGKQTGKQVASRSSMKTKAAPMNQHANVTLKPAGKTAQTTIRKTAKGAAPSKQPATFHGALAACVRAQQGNAQQGKSQREGMEPAKVSRRKASAIRCQASTRVQSVAARSARPDTKAKTIGRAPQSQVAQSRATDSLRSISVNLRLSRAEHVQIQAGAVEAGLTLAAYIRESTLRIRLTDERERQLTRDRKPSRRSAEMPAMESDAIDSYDRSPLEMKLSGFLLRLKNLWFGNRLAAIA